MQTRMKWTLVFVVAVMTAACGDSKSSLLPTAPSGLATDSPSVDASTAAGHYGAMGNNGNGNGNGNNNGGGNGNGNGNEGGNGNGNGNGNPRTPTNTSPAPTAPVPPGKAKVEFEGLIQFADATLIKVNGQTVYLTSETVIRHGSRPVLASDLHQGDRVHVRADRVAPASGGSTASAETRLEAAVILVQKPGDPVADSLPGAAVEPDVLVSVTAFDDKAIEVGADRATFRLSRTGTATQLAASLSVSFTLGGTASATDYTAVPLTANFLANQATVDVMVTPVNDGVAESPESVMLTLSASTAYEPGSPATATVMISDAPPPQVAVWVPDPQAGEIGNDARFVVTRTGNLSSSLTVTVMFSGTAGAPGTSGVDYLVSGADNNRVNPIAVTFPAGVNEVTIWVEPFPDAVVEPMEFIEFAVVDGEEYDLGPIFSGLISIFAR